MALRRSRRLAGLPPVKISPNPPDAPETELSIRIPIRRFPPANAKEKKMSFDAIYQYLSCIDKTSQRTLKIFYMAKIFYEIAEQPILFAKSKKFREAVNGKVSQMKNVLLDKNWTDEHSLLADAMEEFEKMLEVIHLHPWYKE